MNLLIVFTLIGVWELCKLEEVAKITMGQSPNSKNYTKNPNDYILVQGNADIKNGKVVPRVWTTQLTKQAEKGDLLLSVRAPVGDIGKTEYNVVIGRGIAGIKGNEFVFQQLSKMKDNNYWARYSTGSTFESISSNDIRGAIFFIPEKIEQESIGLFLKNIDNFIVLHQRKLDQLKELKKAYLKAMFVSMNTKNNKVPKLRFTDFEGDWEQRKLGNISKMYQPQTITGTELLPSGYPVFGANGYIGFYSEMNHENDQVTISARGEGTGTINYVNGPVWITGNSMVINVNDFDINKRFLHANLSSNSLKKYITGGAQPQLTRDILTSVPIKLPNIFEQNKIGLFFKQLDETVNLHQNKLTQLKFLKKSYLQNMFI